MSDGDITYLILVGPAQSNDPRYRGVDPLDVTLTNRDNEVDHGNSPETATHIAPPSSNAGTLKSASDADWYSFDAQAGLTYTFVTALGTLRDSTLALFAPDGTTEIAFDDDTGPGFASRIKWTAPAFGRYFVRAGAFRGGSGTYSLAITVNGAVVPPSEGSRRYLSVRTSSVVGGIQVEDEDIVAFDGSRFSMWFDGSDVGLEHQRIDAFDVISSNQVLLSFTDEVVIPGLGAPVADTDIVRFTASSLGTTTSGGFELLFDGSDVGLSAGREDIKGIKRLSDGRLLITTNFQVDVPNLRADNEDILSFQPTSLGSNTAGEWSIYFDGSDVDLSSADLDAVSLDSVGNIYLSIGDDATVSGLRVSDEDIFIFQPTSLGDATTGSFRSSLAFDGSLFGISDDVFGFALT